jgi:hypothetical protein
MMNADTTSRRIASGCRSSSVREDRMKRRILLGGLGLALGAMATPAVAQDPPARRVTLGRPVSVSAPAATPPAGVITPVQAIVPGGVVPPPSMGMPVGTFPVPMGVVPQPTPGAPSVTEVRDPSGRIAVGSSPGVTIGPPISYGAPGTVLNAPGPGSVIVPSVGPDVCPPGMEAPMFGGPPPAEVGAPIPGPGQRLASLVRFGGGENPWWTSAEYLMWWTRSTQLPPLVTTSSPQFGGFLGVGDTQTLLGGSFGDTFHSGARFGVGRWFDCEQSRGIEGRFFFLSQNGTTFATDTNTYPVLARPFFNANQPVGSFAEVVAAPGLATGGVVVELKNSLWGADVNFRRNLGGSECARLDALVGYRYLNFKEQLTITESFVRTPGSNFDVGVPATAGLITDSFRTENNFHGGQIGLTGEVRRGRWYLDGRASIAFGTTFQRAEIGGSQVLNLPNGTVGTYQGGLLAVPGANLGAFNQNKFAVLPEVGLNLGYHVTPRMRVFVGYNFLYLSNVLRPAGVIDTVVDAARIPNFPLPGNPTPLGGLPRPTPQMRTTDFFAQGISFGLSFTW